MSDLLPKVFGDLIAYRSPNVFNPWRDSDQLDLGGYKAPLDRLDRLSAHFNCSPRYVLIGEAPGYQGCHFSGVPFTNESLLIAGKVPRVNCPMRTTMRRKPWSEPSATIVWDTLHKLGIADKTVMWNAFAWHPYKPSDPYSNRAPTKPELEAGWNVLRGVVNLFASAQFIAVGNVAAGTLDRLGIPYAVKVRHPSMGGATEFRAQMAAIVNQ